MKVVFTGDICLANLDPRRYGLAPDLSDRLEGADLVVGNLESPLTGAAAGSDQPLRFRQDPVAGPVLRRLGAVTLANNHILDCGVAGLRDTVHFLEQEGIRHCGAGETLRDALRPAVVESGNVRLALLGCSRWCATRGRRPGCVSDRSTALAREIRRLKREGCFVVVLPHWNYEYVHLPSPESRRLARRWIRAGADLVVGSHPHVVQGVERIAERAVYYSLGNFVFYEGSLYADLVDYSRLKEGLLLVVTIAGPGRPRCEAVPVLLAAGETRCAQGADRERIERCFLESSQPLQEPWGRYRRTFYARARTITAKESRALRDLAARGGIGSILRRLPRARLQDLLIRWHAMRRP